MSEDSYMEQLDAERDAWVNDQIEQQLIGGDGEW